MVKPGSGPKIRKDSKSFSIKGFISLINPQNQYFPFWQKLHPSMDWIYELVYPVSERLFIFNSTAATALRESGLFATDRKNQVDLRHSLHLRKRK